MLRVALPKHHRVRRNPHSMTSNRSIVPLSNIAADLLGELVGEFGRSTVGKGRRSEFNRHTPFYHGCLRRGCEQTNYIDSV